MAKPLISVDAIFTRALELLDAEGAGALNARRLAGELRCSTRTLYQQVGNREQFDSGVGEPAFLSAEAELP